MFYVNFFTYLKYHLIYKVDYIPEFPKKNKVYVSTYSPAFICLAISLIGRFRLTYRLATYDLLRNSIFEGNCILSRISGVS